MKDVLLIFVPQWSPFQPPLSLPSLAAWLRRSGYGVKCLDANILLYNWVFSHDCAQTLLALLDKKDLTDAEANAYRSIVKCSSQFQEDINRLKASAVPPSQPREKQLYVQNHYLAIKAFATYLSTVSEISGDFSLSPYEFRINTETQACSESLEAFAEKPPQVLRKFVDWVVDQYVLPNDPLVVGLSCIGEEQLPFTLLFGKAIKQRLPRIPILVGGTILSRIFERNVLKPDWFRQYFDVIVRNEGEKPSEKILSNLAARRPLTEGVPGIVYLDGDQICSTEPAAPLKPVEVPTPDFDDLPLNSYFSSEITLPVLSSRGCYWGKCEFCHHYMVYGDEYSAYNAQEVVRIIHDLAGRYKVRHFAFNDEAIPPKIVTALGQLLPDHSESGYTFTGLIKFEKYYKRDAFVNLSRVGFRSLYIGLESASERVLALMKKPNTITTIKSNLRDATEAGIWAHCFLFFGFPGETEEDAKETFEFIISNSDIVGSFGCGTFVLEHNAPIQKHVDSFHVQILKDQSFSDVSVYYDYSVSEGISRERAREWADRLYEASSRIDKYRSTGWIPREFMLCLISHLTPDELVRECVRVDQSLSIPPGATVADIVSLISLAGGIDEGWLINRMSRRVALVKNKTFDVFQLCLNYPLNIIALTEMTSQFTQFLSLAGRPTAAPEKTPSLVAEQLSDEPVSLTTPSHA